MPVGINQGTTLEIVEGAPATYDAAGFAALSYTAVGSIESYGEYGATSVVTEFTGVEDAIVRKFIGASNSGQISLAIGRDLTDAGQVLLSDATKPSDASYGTQKSVKITDSEGVQYFTCKISSYTTNRGDVNAVVRASVNVEIDNEIVEV